MIKRLSIELKKIMPYPTFWIFIGLYVLLTLIVFCSLPFIKFNGPASALSLKTYYTFPDIWHTLTYIAGLFNLLLGVLVIILITNEFNFRTVRQNIIDGWSISDVLSAKVTFLILLAFCTTVFVFLLGLIYGVIEASPTDTGSMFGEVNFILAYFVQALAYLCFALFMGTLFKKAGLGIIFFLVYSKIVEPLIGLAIPNSIKAYLPFHNIANLIDFPAVKVIGITVYDSESPLGIHFLITLVYSFLFIFATYLLLKKRDN